MAKKTVKESCAQVNKNGNDFIFAMLKFTILVLKPQKRQDWLLIDIS